MDNADYVDVHGVMWSATECSGVPWNTWINWITWIMCNAVECRGVPWSAPEYMDYADYTDCADYADSYGVLWSAAECSGVPWSVVESRGGCGVHGSHGLPCSDVECRGKQLNTWIMWITRIMWISTE